MKKLSLLIMIIIAFCSCNKQSELTGEWTSESKYGSKETTIFKEDGSLIVIKENKIFDFGSGSNLNTTAKYEVDDSHTPHWIDFVIYNNGEEMIRVKGIYELLSESTLKVCFNTNSNEQLQIFVRPKDFNEGDVQILTKK